MITYRVFLKDKTEFKVNAADVTVCSEESFIYYNFTDDNDATVAAVSVVDVAYITD